MDEIIRQWDYHDQPDIQACDLYYGRIGELVGKLGLDYLTIGAYVDPVLCAVFVEFFETMPIDIARLSVRGGEIFFDGISVGRIVGVRGVAANVGKKFQVHFTGKWFRAGLTELDAVAFVNQLEVYVAELPDLPPQFEQLIGIQGDMWIKYRSLDRVDVAGNFSTTDLVSCPRDVMCIDLPDDMFWRTFLESDTLDSGEVYKCQTVYASATSNPLKNRGDYPILRVYQKPEHQRAGVIRIELQIPRVLHPTFGGSIEGAMVKAATVFACLTRRLAIVTGLECHTPPYDPVADREDLDRALIFKAIDFQGKWYPDHIFRQRYAGHASKVSSRCFKQAATLIERFGGAFLAAKYCDIQVGYANAFEDKEARLTIQAPFDDECLTSIEKMCADLRKAELPDTLPYSLRLVPKISVRGWSRRKEVEGLKRRRAMRWGLKPDDAATLKPLDKSIFDILPIGVQLDIMQEDNTALRSYIHSLETKLNEVEIMCDDYDDKFRFIGLEHDLEEKYKDYASRFQLPKVVRVHSAKYPDIDMPPHLTHADFYRHDHWLGAYRKYHAGERSSPPRWGSDPERKRIGR